MSRLMSVAMTTDAVIDRRKTVTRRKGWWLDKNGRRLLHAGDTLTLCRKVQGRKPGEPIERLAEVEVVSVTRESLELLYGIAGPDTAISFRGTVRRWAEEEVEREGFPGMDPAAFVETYFLDAQGMAPDDEVTRIEWRYLDDLCQPCADQTRCDRCNERMCEFVGPEPRACGVTCCDCPCDCLTCVLVREDMRAELERQIERDAR